MMKVCSAHRGWFCINWDIPARTFYLICSSSLYRSVFCRHGYLFHFGAVLFFFLISSQRDRKQAGSTGPSLVQIPDRSVGMAGMLLGLGSWQGTHYWCTCKARTEGQFQTKQNTCANLLSSANLWFVCLPGDMYKMSVKVVRNKNTGNNKRWGKKNTKTTELFITLISNLILFTII